MTARCVALILASLLASSGGAHAQGSVSKVGTAVASYLEIPVGATAIAMGGAFASVADDATSLYWNAAGSALLTHSELVVSHTNWIADTRVDFGAYVLPLGDIGSLGLSITSLSMDDMAVRTVEQPEGTGEYFSAGDLAAGLTYARKLSDRFAIGFTGKYLRQSIWHEAAEGFAVDAGTSFRTDLLGGMVIGGTITNFGTSMTMSGRDTRQFIRIDPNKTGSTDQVPTDIELQSWDLPLQIQIGVSVPVVHSEDYGWLVAVEAVHSSDNDESVNLGTQMGYRNTVFVRGGFQGLFLPGYYNGLAIEHGEGGLSFGFGVVANSVADNINLKFDYAFRDMGRLENIHTFSLGMVF